QQLIESRSDVLAAWEGGSAATGYLDDYSDLDLAIVCADDAVETVIACVDDFLEEKYGIEKRFRVPEPAWHGFSQCYYRIRNTPAYYFLDISFIRRSNPEKFTASDRHGQAVVWFEKKPVVDRSPTPDDQVTARARRLYLRCVTMDFVFIAEVEKAIARNRFSEAFPAYFNFIARFLAVMLNLKHRPSKADFGLRYGYRDYPADDAKWIEELFKVASLDDLSRKFTTAVARYHVLVEDFRTVCGYSGESSRENQAQ
ncbi:MAG TPA: hypothetical protein PLV45_13525, partial [bacterium]|nr:hypothetical protein [bacterium]